MSNVCKLTTGGGYSCIIIIGGYGDFSMKDVVNNQKRKKVLLFIGILIMLCGVIFHVPPSLQVSGTFLSFF